MDRILQRDASGECFTQCRDIVSEAAVKRQERIDNITRGIEAGGRRKTDTSGSASEAFSDSASANT